MSFDKAKTALHVWPIDSSELLIGYSYSEAFHQEIKRQINSPDTVAFVDYTTALNFKKAVKLMLDPQKNKIFKDVDKHLGPEGSLIEICICKREGAPPIIMATTTNTNIL